MNNQCPYCRKKPFENQGYLANHILRSHYDIIHHLTIKRAKEKQTLRNFTNKITNLPETISVPTEYLKFFID